ncbi:hypothetical protein M0813_06430 [Anaeramoeba flamelloides]|uniref:AN1-type domain-containing protein n=1 Tax=Anaeramoeba flamelloides TaxID=1746091 RepID=A0ABQ8XDY0_9EUKA|nr:hypothetical protein M0813_06430 [Anaeramoeba flamelloides]
MNNHNCITCQEINIRKTASCYCTVCKVHLCTEHKKKIHECYPLNKHIILAINNQRKTQTQFIDNNRNPFTRKPNVESQKRKNLFLFNNNNSLFKQKEKKKLQQKEKKKILFSEKNKENELGYQHKTSTSLSQRPKARTDAAEGGKIFDPFYAQNKMNKEKGTNEKKKNRDPTEEKDKEKIY